MKLDRVRAQLGPRLFNALYSSLSPLYDRVSAFFFAGQWAVWQRWALEFVHGRDVLELGFGTGELLLEMCRRGLTPVGVDASPRMHAIARRKLKRAGCEAVALLGSSERLPFPDNSFDTLVCTFPSSYILNGATWKEAHRVLRPGGKLVVVLSGELLPVDHRSRLLIRFHRLVYGEPAAARARLHDLVEELRPDREPPSAHDVPEWLEQLDRPGFTTNYMAWRDGKGLAHILVAHTEKQ